MTNRFQGVLATQKERNEAQFNGIYASIFNKTALRGELTEAGLGTDNTANEDYSSSSTFFSFIATSNQVANRITLQIEDSSVPQNGATDAALWLGGVAILTNGITFQVRDSSGTVLFSFEPVVNIHGFSRELGADVHRDLAGK